MYKHYHLRIARKATLKNEVALLKFKSVFYFMIIVMVFLFPQKVKAESRGSVHFYQIVEDGNLMWTSLEVEQSDNINEKEAAYIIFTELFENEEVPFIPDNVRLLGVSVFDGCLNLNVSGDILNYGGTYYEQHMRNQIIKTALSIPGINKVSLTIETIRNYLTEGCSVTEESQWNESPDIIYPDLSNNR